MPELVHGVFKLGFRHLPVRHTHAGRGHQGVHVFGHPLQPLHSVVDPEHLAFALDLAFQHLAQHGIIPPQHSRSHRLAILRRGFNDGKLAYAGHGKLQSARNGRGRQGEHIHVLFEGLEFFLVAHAKTLFFVQNQQGKIGQFDVA